MLLIAGIDPGRNGAIGIFDRESDKLVAVYPLPNYKIQVGKSTRTRLDIDELSDLFAMLVIMGVKLIGIEDVSGGSWQGGRKQGAAGAFQFGYVFGLLCMAAKATGIDWTTASPAVWKLTEKVPRDEHGIVAKADAEFGEQFKPLWHGPRGASLHDRAEAAFLSRYFARRVWPTRQERQPLRQEITKLTQLSTEPVTIRPTVRMVRGKAKSSANGSAKRT